jgi:hypothetical protein
MTLAAVLVVEAAKAVARQQHAPSAS